jgi:hypothetical protein
MCGSWLCARETGKLVAKNSGLLWPGQGGLGSRLLWLLPSTLAYPGLLAPAELEDVVVGHGFRKGSLVSSASHGRPALALVFRFHAAAHAIFVHLAAFGCLLARATAVLLFGGVPGRTAAALPVDMAQLAQPSVFVNHVRAALHRVAALLSVVAARLERRTRLRKAERDGEEDGLPNQHVGTQST